MTPEEEKRLIELVSAMRASQILYFRTRSQEALVAAKTFERLVDKWLADYQRTRYGG